MHKRKVLVLITFALSLLVIGGLAIYTTKYLSRSFIFDKGGTLVLGDAGAKVQLVLFEDFQCSHCQYFSEQILPQIQSRYIDSGRVCCTIVPLSLFAGSRALTNTVLTIFEDSPDRAFLFLKQSFKLFPKTKVTNQALLGLAGKVGGIDLDRIKYCMQKRCHYGDIDRNLKKARSIMRKNVLVPMLYINGSAASVGSFDHISAEIERAARHRPGSSELGQGSYLSTSGKQIRETLSFEGVQ